MKIDDNTDFGNLHLAEPLWSRSGASPEDVADAWDLGSEALQPITIRGRGHSCNGQTVTDGMLIHIESDGGSVRRISSDRFEVPCSMSWGDVEEQLVSYHGCHMGVLPDYLGLSVGGTLSVGGIGLGSVRHGMQLDLVERARLLVRGGSEAIWCSRIEQPELFRFALGGLGQCGVLDRVVLRATPYQPYTHLWRLDHGGDLSALCTFLENLQWLNVDCYQGYIHGGSAWEHPQIVSEVGRVSGLPDSTPEIDRTRGAPELDDSEHRIEFGYPKILHKRRVEWVEQFNDHARMWADYVLDVVGAAKMLETVMEMATKPPLRQTLKAVYILAIRPGQSNTPFAFAPHIDAPMAFGIGLYTMPGLKDPVGIGRTKKVLRELLEKCVDLGGRPYLYGCHDLDDSLRRRLYGADCQRLGELKHIYDVQGLNLGGARILGLTDEEVF